MPESSPLGDPPGSAGVLPLASGEIVRDQTVRARVPVAPASEITVKTAVPVEPPAEQTVRVFVPSAVPAEATTEEHEEVEEVSEIEPEPEIEPEALDVSALVFELEAQGQEDSPADVPRPRSEEDTLPIAVAKPGRKRRAGGPSLRSDPPAVSGEVSVSEPEPEGPRGHAAKPGPQRIPRAAPTPGARRDDPPLVSGEVAVAPEPEPAPPVPARDVYVIPGSAPGSQAMMTSSGPQSIMTASGPQSLMTASGPHSVMAMTASGAAPVLKRTSSDSGYATVDRLADGTGPHPVMAPQESTRDSLVLWALAGTLVVLAVGVVMMVISWSR